MVMLSIVAYSRTINPVGDMVLNHTVYIYLAILLEWIIVLSLSPSMTHRLEDLEVRCASKDNKLLEQDIKVRY